MSDCQAPECDRPIVRMGDALKEGDLIEECPDRLAAFGFDVLGEISESFTNTTPLFGVCRVEPVDGDGPDCGAETCGEEPQQRGLAGSVRAGHDCEARSDPEVETGEDDTSATPDGNSVEGDHWSCCR